MTATCKTSKQTDTHSFPHDCILNFIKHAMKMYFCLLSTNLQHTRTDEICAHILQITDIPPPAPPPPLFLGAFPSLADFLSLRSLCCVAIHLGEVCRLTGVLFLQFLAPLWRACLKHKSPFLSPQKGQTT